MRLFITNKQICGVSYICVLFIVMFNLYSLFQICVVLELLLNLVLDFYLKWSLMSFAVYRVDLVTTTFELAENWYRYFRCRNLLPSLKMV